MQNQADDAESRKKFNRDYHLATRYSGIGIETTVHMPCGFCAAPDFIVAKIISVESTVQREHVCKTCGRGVRAEFTEDTGGKHFEFVQTRGDDPPAWMPPPRRVGAP